MEVTTTLPESRTAPFAARLASHGDRPAVLTGTGTLTYRELARRVDAVAAQLGPHRRLVALAAGNDVGSLTAYLAALLAGHPVLLLPADKPAAWDGLVAAYDPDVVVRSTGTEPVLEERRPATVHDLHPELALLLSTSGSTGSPKLVRLSYANLQANAESIAEALGITARDRAATTLPMHYCYGLSVINSHLLRGAGLVLTDLSVVDPCFWELFRDQRATTFAAVPYTFDLLDRVGFESMDLPHLRYVTQAGGRLAPDAVRRYAELGSRLGWDLVVMYGQTEATARMACLPPELAATHPHTIGVPVPGGAFRIDPVPGLAEGELVYTGPNVMLGYAQEPGDLALGRTVSELRTGDLARQHGNGLYEVVGRRSRFVKIVGLRIDLAEVERILATRGVVATSAGSDDGIVVAVESPRPRADLEQLLAQRMGLPRAAVAVHAVDRLPRLATGKPDYAAVLALGAHRSTVPAGEGSDGGPTGAARGPVAQIFMEELDSAEVDEHSTFVSLGGDSLSYVATSVRLEDVLGQVPPDWHVTPVGQLEPEPSPAPPPPAARWFRPLETSIVLRAVAIVLIVGTHAKLFAWPGAAHVLIAVAGYNFARFQLLGDRAVRLRRHLRSIARIVVPSVGLIALAHLITGQYGVVNILLLNALLGPETWTTRWHFWFIEVLVYVLVAMTALLSVPWADRAERRLPFAFPLGLMAIGLLPRFGLLDAGVPHPQPVLWLFALGWAIARAQTVRRQWALSAVAALTVPGFFGVPERDLLILAGVLLLIWAPSVPLPTGFHRVAGLLASASLYIYLTHWVVYPRLVDLSTGLAVVASLAVGVSIWAMSAALARMWPRLRSLRLWRLGGARRRGSTGTRPVVAGPGAQCGQRVEGPDRDGHRVAG